MKPETLAKVREEFEAWMRSRHPHKDIWRNEYDGPRYAAGETEGLWEAWMARAEFDTFPERVEESADVRQAPDEWQLVPVEPTKEMLLAYESIPTPEGEEWDAWPKAEWKAMLAAAPKPVVSEPSTRADNLHIASEDQLLRLQHILEGGASPALPHIDPYSKELISLLQSFADRIRNAVKTGLIHPDLFEADHAVLMDAIRFLKKLPVAAHKSAVSEPAEKHPRDVVAHNPPIPNTGQEGRAKVEAETFSRSSVKESLTVRPKVTDANIRRLTGLWRFRLEVLPSNAVDFEGWLFQLDSLLDAKTGVGE